MLLQDRRQWRGSVSSFSNLQRAVCKARVVPSGQKRRLDTWGCAQDKQFFFVWGVVAVLFVSRKLEASRRKWRVLLVFAGACATLAPSALALHLRRCMLAQGVGFARRPLPHEDLGDSAGRPRNVQPSSSSRRSRNKLLHRASVADRRLIVECRVASFRVHLKSVVVRVTQSSSGNRRCRGKFADVRSNQFS